MNIDIEFDGEQVDIIAHLRTVIILAARSSTSSEIEIDAVDQIVETTIDFMKNLLEHMARNSNNDSLAPNDLLNTLRVSFR